jgi:hypothetical protein
VLSWCRDSCRQLSHWHRTGRIARPLGNSGIEKGASLKLGDSISFDRTRPQIFASGFTLVLLVIAFALPAGGASGETGRRLGTCGLLQPLTPTVYNPSKTGFAQANVGCPDSGFSATVKLNTLAGNTLTAFTASNLTFTYPGYYYYINTNTVSCAGANVHSHLYANSGGQGQSQNSGNNSDCTY